MTAAVSRALDVVVLSLGLPRYLWPVTLTLFGLATWGGFKAYGHRRLTARPTVFLLTLSAAVFVGMPFYAAAFGADLRTSTDATQELPSNLLGLFWYGYLVAVAIAVFLARGYRWPLAAVAAFLVWMTFAVMFVAIMAVSGIWL